MIEKKKSGKRIGEMAAKRVGTIVGKEVKGVVKWKDKEHERRGMKSPHAGRGWEKQGKRKNMGRMEVE